MANACDDGLTRSRLVFHTMSRSAPAEANLTVSTTLLSSSRILPIRSTESA